MRKLYEKRRVEIKVNIYLVVILVILIAVFFDERSHKIPNILIILGIFTGVIFSWHNGGFNGVVRGIFGITAPVILLFVFYALKMLGAGDIKLFSAIGSFVGAKFVITIILMSILCGGLIAIIIVMVRKNAINRFRYMWNYIVSIYYTKKISAYQNYSSENDGLFKFSYAIFCGFLLTYLTKVVL